MSPSFQITCQCHLLFDFNILTSPFESNFCSHVIAVCHPQHLLLSDAPLASSFHPRFVQFFAVLKAFIYMEIGMPQDVHSVLGCTCRNKYSILLCSISDVSEIYQVQLLLQDMTQTHPVQFQTSIHDTSFKRLGILGFLRWPCVLGNLHLPQFIFVFTNSTKSEGHS